MLSDSMVPFVLPASDPKKAEADPMKSAIYLLLNAQQWR